MPSALTYPGVYIEERSSGVRTITGVATSIAAFIDSFPRGPLNEAVQCLSYADFERNFGGIHTLSEASYGIKQFFQNGGAECWVVRVATLDDAAPANNAIEARLVINDEPGAAGDAMFRVLAGRRLRGQVATDPGVWGNSVLLDVDYDTSASTETFNLSISEVVVENGRRRVLRNEVFRNLTMDAAAPNYAVDTVNETSRIVQLDRMNLAGTAALSALAVAAPFPRPAVTGTAGGDLPMPPAIPASGSAISVTVANDTDPPVARAALPGTISYTGTITTYAALRPHIESAIRALAVPTLDETERSLLAGATVRLLGAGTAASPFRYVVQGGRGSPDYLPGSSVDFEVGVASDLGFPAAVAPNVQQYRLGGGLDGVLPVGATALIGNALPKTGIFALDDVDLVNILCIPAAADLADAVEMRAVYDQATAYIAARRGFLLIDIAAATATLDAMQTWMMENDSLRSRNAAVYFPRTFVPDSANGNRLRSIGASGTVAGLYARTDSTRGVWKAPAGTDAKLENVQALTYTLTDLQNGALNPLGINCLRTFPGYSHISWGARTLDGADALASEWKYIPIRRLALFIEESLFRGTKWVVFEPNDEPLWAQIRLNVGVFLNGLFRQGAFQGKTPQEAFFVKCDKETTTQADRNLGIVNILVGFAPLKPAEFVVITIQQIAGDLQ